MRMMGALAAMVVLTAVAGSADDAAKAEMGKMEGTWTFDKLVQSGTAVPAEQLATTRMVVKGDTRTVMEGEMVKTKSTFKIDPAAKPKTIDITVSEGSLKGKTVYGIYDLDGDTFRVCIALEGKDRPKDLKSEEDSGTVLMVFKRAKEKKE